jgi:hypothetical protein
MKRLIPIPIILVAIALLASPVIASDHNDSNSPMNKKQCEEAGGYWSNNRGEKSCNFITEVPYERPDVLTDEPDELRDFWANTSEDSVIIEFEQVSTQRGNVGIKGTSSTLRVVITCKMLGASDLFPPEICDWIAQGYDPDPFD